MSSHPFNKSLAAAGPVYYQKVFLTALRTSVSAEALNSEHLQFEQLLRNLVKSTKFFNLNASYSRQTGAYTGVLAGHRRLAYGVCSTCRQLTWSLRITIFHNYAASNVIFSLFKILPFRNICNYIYIWSIRSGWLTSSNFTKFCTTVYTVTKSSPKLSVPHVNKAQHLALTSAVTWVIVVGAPAVGHIRRLFYMYTMMYMSQPNTLYIFVFWLLCVKCTYAHI